MNAKVLATSHVRFPPESGACAIQRPDEKQRKWSRARFACGQERQWVGREWRSDAGRGRIRRKRDHGTVVKASVSGGVNKMMGDGEHFRTAQAH